METFDLKTFRLDNNLTQKELANIFGCNQNFISRIEAGIRPLPSDKISLLASRYGDISKYYTATPIVINNNKNSNNKNSILGNNNNVTTNEAEIIKEAYQDRITALETENAYLKERISHLETTNTQLLGLLNKK